MTKHSCSITDLDLDGQLSQWRVICSRCGYVGAPQDYHDDAVALANRHEEIGGFDR